MSLNYREIDAILAELPLENSHIQDIRQPDFKSLVLDLYRPKDRYSLLISLNPGKTRLHTLSYPKKSYMGLQRFAQFLRSTLRGGRILQAGQLGSDRIIKFVVRKGDREVFFWIRLWGGAANIIVTDPDGTILDAFYRRPGRGEVSGGSYRPEKEEPSTPSKEFPLRSFPGEGSFNRRVEEYYHQAENREELEALQDRAGKTAEEALRKAQNLLRNIENRLASYGSFQEYKEYGDLLKANLYRLPRGQQWFETENFYRDNNLVRIELDPRLPPEQNVEAYYKKYKKARRGLETLKEDKANAQVLLQKAREDQEAIRNSTDIQFLKNYLEERKLEKPKERSDNLPGLVYSSGGFTLRLGRTAKENDHLLRHWAKGNDYWIHARDWPGAHVFIRYKKDKSIPLEVLLDAGNLALHYSHGKASGQGEFYYTQVKYLRRAKDGKAGLVLPTREKNLSIQLDKKRLERLFSRSDIDN